MSSNGRSPLMNPIQPIWAQEDTASRVDTCMEAEAVIRPMLRWPLPSFPMPCLHQWPYCGTQKTGHLYSHLLSESSRVRPRLPQPHLYLAVSHNSPSCVLCNPFKPFPCFWNSLQEVSNICKNVLGGGDMLGISHRLSLF